VKTLFEPPLSHTNDPISSYEAADKMIKSGELNRQEQRVWKAIRLLHKTTRCDNFTAKELNYWTGIGYFIIQRRLSGLHNKGKIKRIGEKRNGCCVWCLA